MSNEVRARLDGQSTTSPGGGFLTAELWNVNGTDDGTTISGKKEYLYIIDEDTNIISAPIF